MKTRLPPPVVWKPLPKRGKRKAWQLPTIVFVQWKPYTWPICGEEQATRWDRGDAGNMGNVVANGGMGLFVCMSGFISDNTVESFTVLGQHGERLFPKRDVLEVWWMTFRVPN